jgi:hypothetical protein
MKEREEVKELPADTSIENDLDVTSPGEQKGKQAVFDGAGTSIENDWDVTPYGEQK